jgi:hypothetical protein
VNIPIETVVEWLSQNMSQAGDGRWFVGTHDAVTFLYGDTPLKLIAEIRRYAESLAENTNAAG